MSQNTSDSEKSDTGNNEDEELPLRESKKTVERRSVIQKHARLLDSPKQKTEKNRRSKNQNADNIRGLEFIIQRFVNI